METVVRGVKPPMPIVASTQSEADRRTLAIRVVRTALTNGTEAVAWQLGLAPDQFRRALACAVAEFNMVTAGFIDPEQGARIGSEGLAASLRIAGFRVVAARRTSRTDCGNRLKMAGKHGRLIAVDECNARHGAMNA